MISKFEFKKSVIVSDPCYILKNEAYDGIWGDEKTYNYRDGQIGDMMFVMSTVIGDGRFPTEGVDETTNGLETDKSLPVDSGTIAIINGASDGIDQEALAKESELNYLKFDGDGYAIIDDSCVRKSDCKLESYYSIILRFDDGRMYEFKIVLWYDNDEDIWDDCEDEDEESED